VNEVSNVKGGGRGNVKTGLVLPLLVLVPMVTAAAAEDGVVIEDGRDRTVWVSWLGGGETGEGKLLLIEVVVVTLAVCRSETGTADWRGDAVISPPLLA
jgi:hypothetical protein